LAKADIGGKRMDAGALRKAFVEFFVARGHLERKSASLVPIDDKSLLFNSAGMVPFKKYFSGELKPPSKRIVSVQKCFRTTDWDLIGDASHLTFFEMLGNFSFGDYFKKEACAWALELMTETLGFNAERLFYTVHTSDDEAFEVWRELGIAERKIYRLGDEHNWWGPAGREGPCGPCSEIHVYTGSEDIGALEGEQISKRIADGDGFLEVYNLVFTQFDRQADGSDTPLKNKNIDTGMGLERVLTLMNGAESPYDASPLLATTRQIGEEIKKGGLSKPPYGKERQQRDIRITADHVRAAVMLIGDGVRPSSSGKREDVLRRLIRKAALFCNDYKLGDGALADIAQTVVDEMQGEYSELAANAKTILNAMTAQQERFSQSSGSSRKEKLEAALDAILKDGDSAKKYFENGVTKSKLGYYEAAVEEYSKAIEEGLQNPEVYYNRGDAKHNLKEYEAAIADYDKAIELEPDNAMYYNNRGDAKYNLKEYEAAIADLDNAIELEPDNAMYYYNRGDAKNALKEYKAAIADLDNAIELNSDDADYYIKRGDAKYNLKEYEAAMADFDNAIELEIELLGFMPDNAMYYNTRGFAKYNLKEYEAAIASCDRAIELLPDNADFYIKRGFAKYNLKEYEAAIADYDKAIELKPDNAVFYILRGFAKYNLKEYEAAIADCDKAIELKPDNRSYYPFFYTVLKAQSLWKTKKPGEEKLDSEAIRELDQIFVYVRDKAKSNGIIFSREDVVDTEKYFIKGAKSTKLAPPQGEGVSSDKKQAITNQSDLKSNPKSHPRSKGVNLGKKIHETVLQIKEMRMLITGTKAFQLYETLGATLEELEELADIKGLSLDKEGFDAALAESRERTRQRTKFDAEANLQRLYAELEPTEFIGDENESADGTLEARVSIRAILKADGGQGASLKDARKADGEVVIVLDKTPFYAERGGQVGDTGWLEGDKTAGARDNRLAEVVNTQSPYTGISAHTVRVVKGKLKVGDYINARVDGERRQKIMRNHTATHLIHAALRQRFGEQLKQAGSLVHPDYLRFDFNHDQPLTADEIFELQDIVNGRIRDNQAVAVEYADYDKAVRDGALAFFGERYEAGEVRTIKIDAPWSYELCGGTHMAGTGGIGAFVIVSQSGIGAGLRRIFAVTGVAAEKQMQAIQKLALRLDAPLDRLGEQFERALKERDAAQKELDKYQRLYLALLQSGAGADGASAAEGEDLTYALSPEREIAVKIMRPQAPNVDMLRKFGDSVMAKLRANGVLIAAAVIDEQPKLVTMVTKDLNAVNVRAGDIAKSLARKMGGGGGGSASTGQGGGKSEADLNAALTADSVKRTLDELYGD